MPVLVDSNVLLDLMSDDQDWYPWSSDMVARLMREDRLVINSVVYAEVSIRFSDRADLDRVLPDDLYRREDIPFEAAFAAGKAFAAYRRRGGTKTSPLPDFLIGAHAAVAGYRLLTRDVRRYRLNFPGIELIAPN